KFIQCVHALWVKTKDDEFLNEIWPATLKTFDFMMSITDRDGLSRRSGSEYEQPELYNAVLWIGAMEALEQMAQHKRASALLARLRTRIVTTRETAEKILWNEQYGFYQYNA